MASKFTRNRLIRGPLLTLPLWCCPCWWLGSWGFHQVELEQLDALVRESELPGYVYMKEGRNDWPFGTSNGAFIRMRWIVRTSRFAELERQVFSMRTQHPGIEFDLKDLGAPPNWMEPRPDAADANERLVLIQVSRGRENYFWELGD